MLLTIARFVGALGCTLTAEPLLTLTPCNKYKARIALARLPDLGERDRVQIEDMHDCCVISSREDHEHDNSYHPLGS